MNLRCKICKKSPSELEEYVVESSYEGIAPDEFVLKEEGTLNKRTGEFYCTECYIKIGMPSGTA
jgi:hypothetical protein